MLELVQYGCLEIRCSDSPSFLLYLAVAGLKTAVNENTHIARLWCGGKRKNGAQTFFFFFKHISNSSILSLLKSLFLLVSILLAEAYYMFSNFVYSIISSIVVFVVFYQYTDYLIPIRQFPK